MQLEAESSAPCFDAPRSSKVWRKSVRNSYKTMPNATGDVQENSSVGNLYSIMCIEAEFLALQKNQMTVVVNVHTFLQLSKFAEELINKEEKKEKRFIGGLKPMYKDHVVTFQRLDTCWIATFDDALDRAYTAEELYLQKRAMDPKRSSSSFRKGHQRKKQKGVFS